MKSLIHLNIDSKNSPHLTFNNVDGYTEENNGDKYLAFASKGKNKKVLKKYIQLWDEIKNPIETINGGKPVEYNFFFIKIMFELDDDLPLDKILDISSMIIVVGSVLQQDRMYCPHVCLHECVHEFVYKL